MIVISKEERERVQQVYPHVRIIRAKHHYYCEEDQRVLRMLGRVSAHPQRERQSGNTKKKQQRNGWRQERRNNG